MRPVECHQPSPSSFIWGKSSETPTSLDWLPLWVHLYDTFKCAQVVWNSTPLSVKKIIQGPLTESDDAQKLLLLLSAFHDVGKATPDFSGRDSVIFRTSELHMKMKNAGFSYSDLGNSSCSARAHGPIRHEFASAFALEKVFPIPAIPEGLSLRESIAFNRKVASRADSLGSILSAHHGNPKSIMGAVRKELTSLSPLWKEAQRDLAAFVFSLIPDADEVLFRASPLISIEGQVMLAAMVSQADWLASDASIMPLIPTSLVPNLGDLNHPAFLGRWDNIETRTGIPKMEVKFPPADSDWSAIFARRTGFKENVLQSAFIEICKNSPAPEIYVIESEMGSGKTEAALIGAEILAAKHHKNGVMFALPTMATSEAIYDRVASWLESFQEDTGSAFSFSLAHSKSAFSKAGHDQRFESSGWLSGRYRKLLNPFVVGTIDNVLMMGLKVKYAQWRHLGLASKVVIIDEVHSADPFMKTYLHAALTWLATYECPVIILSATLTVADREALVASYSKGRVG